MQTFEFQIVVRLTLSIIIGALIGVERSRKGSPAGVKTHSLVCLGSTLVMLLSIYINQLFGQGDVARMPSQVISGIGFLGAGTILVTSKSQIKGLTSAAGIWFNACVGLTIGLGFYFAAIYATILAIGGVKLLDYVLLGKGDSVVHLMIEYHPSLNIMDVVNILRNIKCKIISMENEIPSEFTSNNEKLRSATMAIEKPKRITVSDIIREIENIHGLVIVVDVT